MVWAVPVGQEQPEHRVLLCFKPLLFSCLCARQQNLLPLAICSEVGCCQSWVCVTCFVLTLMPSLPLLPFCRLHCRPAWYDLPPPPYSSDTESLNQADLPPYRSRSGSAYSASSQAASSLMSVEDSSHSPEQPGPPEGTAEPRDSVPNEGTEEV